MPSDTDRTLVCFGLGPIGAGLFLYEARASGNFSRLVAADVDAELVSAVRGGGGQFTVNIARSDGIDRVTVDGVEALDPTVPADREALVEAVRGADEIATCLPSVAFYDRGGPASPAAVLGEGIARRAEPAPCLVYAAENHNHAAELLRRTVAPRAVGAALARTQMLNTVIGKMSGSITDAGTIDRLGLARLTPSAGRAVLVEEFNRILVSRVALPDVGRGIEVFQEKADLLPFEEAKLYGHNAVHSVIGYLADAAGLATVARAGGDERIMATARRAFLVEAAAGLVARHGRTGEGLFTAEGFGEYARDLLTRMVNPHLNDLVARVGRDPVRKLGWDDRLYGAMRLALAAGVRPTALAKGAAAAVVSMIRRRAELSAPPANLPASVADLDEGRLAALLGEIWHGAAGDEVDLRDELVALTWEGLARLREDGCLST